MSNWDKRKKGKIGMVEMWFKQIQNPENPHKYWVFADHVQKIIEKIGGFMP